jgi:YVTN family beta-propeller protein
MKISLTLLIAITGLSAISNQVSAQSAFTAYKAYKTIPAEGNGNWDYLSIDKDNRRLYCSHGEKVEVFDIDSDTHIASINGQHGVHGIAIATDENKGFISNGGTNDVCVFDLKTNEILTRIPSGGKGVDAITYSPYMHYILLHNSKSHSVTVIDAKTNEVKGTVDAQGKTEFGASDPDGFYYINLEAEGKVAKIDLHKLEVVAVWPLSPDHDPAGMAIDVANHRLFSGARSNNLVVLDTETGKIITTVPIGDHNDAVVYDPETKLIYVSSILADVTVIQQTDKDTYKVIQHIKTKLFSKTMALDTRTKKIYFPSADFDGTVEGKSKILPNTFKVLVYKQ